MVVEEGKRDKYSTTDVVLLVVGRVSDGASITPHLQQGGQRLPEETSTVQNLI